VRNQRNRQPKSNRNGQRDWKRLRAQSRHDAFCGESEWSLSMT
jgi:hypothetical protein